MNIPTIEKTFVVDANSFSASTKLNDYPILAEGNRSFPKGKYTVNVVTSGDLNSLTIIHNVENADLIKNMLNAGKALYVCVVSSPKSSYRKIHKQEAAKQELTWDHSDLSEPPLFTSMIVSVVRQNIKLSHKKHGVNKSWDGVKVVIDKGARLAIGPVIRFSSSLVSIMDFVKDQELEEGQFKVEANTDKDFRFKVSLATNLFTFMKYQGEDTSLLRQSIMVNIMTACLSLLQRDYSEVKEEIYRNLKSLAEYMEKEGIKTLWYNCGFKPELAATKLKPHKVEGINTDEDE